jgi:hypothetical protein
MDVEEALEFADSLVFGITGKHLDSLQKAILHGAWNNQKYREIAQRHHRSEKYVKEVGSELWRLLSLALGDGELCKANFRATVERHSNKISYFEKGIVNINNSVNICRDTSHSPKVPDSETADERSHRQDAFATNEPTGTAKPEVRQDLGDAPDISRFYGNTGFLTELEKWIVRERCRLVALLGMSGIGKTALAVRLVKQIQDDFECVIWRSLRSSPPLEAIQTNLIQFLSNRQETELPATADERLSLLVEYLRKYRCLVVLDDVHMVHSSEQLAGYYQPGYEDYDSLFRRVGELYHNSCLVLLSCEKPREIAALEGENRPVRSLQLDGLGAAAREILKEKGLVEEEKWDCLIDCYRGNPLWLTLVATLIKDLFSGRVSEFLKYDSLFLGEDLQSVLRPTFNRLSESEKKVMSALASQAKPVSISELLEHIHLSPPDLFNAVQSLNRRFLIEKKEQGSETLFTLQPVVKQYVKTQYGL